MRLPGIVCSFALASSCAISGGTGPRATAATGSDLRRVAPVVLPAPGPVRAAEPIEAPPVPEGPVIVRDHVVTTEIVGSEVRVVLTPIEGDEVLDLAIADAPRCDEPWTTTDWVPGAEGYPLAMVQVLCDRGETPTERSSQTMLLHVPATIEDASVTYTAEGSSTREEGACFEYDVAVFRGTTDGVQVRREREAGDEGGGRNCDEAEFTSTVVDLVSLDWIERTDSPPEPGPDPED